MTQGEWMLQKNPIMSTTVQGHCETPVPGFSNSDLFIYLFLLLLSDY